MPEIPPPLPERGKYRALFAWLNKLRGVVISLRPLISHNTRTTVTGFGVFRKSLGGGEGEPGEPGAPLQFKGQWENQAYDENDIVIRHTNAELDDGQQAGTYMAISDIPIDHMPPGEVGGAGAVLGVTLSGDTVVAISVVSGGSGYNNAADVVITGDGTGATAHYATGAEGAITSVTVDTGGSGYTGATAAIVNRTQLWEDFAEGSWPKLTFRVGDKQVVIDSGRDGTDLPKLTIFRDKDSDVSGSISIDTQDLSDILDADPGANIVIKLRETNACDDADFTLKRTVVLRGEYYDIPDP